MLALYINLMVGIKPDILFLFVVNWMNIDSECANLSVYKIHNKWLGIYWRENTLSRLFTIFESCNVSSMKFSICNVVKWIRYFILLLSLYEMFLYSWKTLASLILYFIVSDNASWTIKTSSIRPCNNCTVFVQYSSMKFQK